LLNHFPDAREMVCLLHQWFVVIVKPKAGLNVYLIPQNYLWHIAG